MVFFCSRSQHFPDHFFLFKLVSCIYVLPSISLHAKLYAPLSVCILRLRETAEAPIANQLAVSHAHNRNVQLTTRSR